MPQTAIVGLPMRRLSGNRRFCYCRHGGNITDGDFGAADVAAA